MEITLGVQHVITFASFVTALIVLGGIFVKVHLFVLKQEEQEKKIKELKGEIESLKQHHDNDMKEVVAEEKKELDEIKEELQLLTLSVLACLKGLREQGVDGAVVEAISNIETYLTEKAHD